ncbi:MAG: tetratricopeptide repeat protein [Chlamydiota bacterium]
MFFSRHKLFLTCFITALALIPCSAQIGGFPQPGFPGSAQSPGASAQTGILPGRGNTGIIAGSVRTLDNKPVSNVRVEVISLAQGQPITTQYTTRNGSFLVSNLPEGNYELRAESGVQEATQRVQVGDGQSWVSLRLPNSSAGGNSNVATVSVQQLRVPEKAVSLLRKARQAVDKNKLGEADTYISKALAVYPEYAQAFTFRAILEMQRQQYEQAVADANHAIQADPNYGTGYLVMGAALNCQQKFQDALLSLQRAETLLPNAWQGYFESGKALLRLGRFQEALQQVNKSFALVDPSQHPDLHLLKGYSYLGLHTYGGALSELQQYLSQAPGGAHTAAVRSTLEKIRPLAAAAVAH